MENSGKVIRMEPGRWTLAEVEEFERAIAPLLDLSADVLPTAYNTWYVSKGLSGWEAWRKTWGDRVKLRADSMPGIVAAMTKQYMGLVL